MKHLSCIFCIALSLSLLPGCSKSGPENTTQNTPGLSEEDKAAGAALEAKIKAALAADSSLQGCEIQVDTSEKNAVTLRGTVKNDGQIDRAKEIAMKEPSVKVVWSKLKVQ